MQNTDLFLKFSDAWTIALLYITLGELNNSKLYCYDQNDNWSSVQFLCVLSEYNLSLCSQHLHPDNTL